MALRFLGSVCLDRNPPDCIAGGMGGGGGGGTGAAGKLVMFISVLGMAGGGGIGRVFFSTRASWNLAGVDPARLDGCFAATGCCCCASSVYFCRDTGSALGGDTDRDEP